jgi:MmyB-like transcription regulator ligand binding domain
VQNLLDAHDPCPAVAVDRRGDVQLSNDAARLLVREIPEQVRGVPTNIFRVALHPEGFGSRTPGFTSWARHLLRHLHLLSSRDPRIAALAAEIATWSGLPPRATWGQVSPGDELGPVVTWQVRLADQDLSMYTIMSSFGTPNDITLSELTIELFFPANQATEEYLRHRTGRHHRQAP